MRHQLFEFSCKLNLGRYDEFVNFMAHIAPAVPEATRIYTFELPAFTLGIANSPEIDLVCLGVLESFLSIEILKWIFASMTRRTAHRSSWLWQMTPLQI